MRYPALLAAALAATAVAAPAVAAETSASVAVKYSDLDLSTKAGQEALENRIDKAARSACGMDDANTGSRVRSREARECYQQTRATVHERVARMTARGGARGGPTTGAK